MWSAKHQYFILWPTYQSKTTGSIRSYYNVLICSFFKFRLIWNVSWGVVHKWCHNLTLFQLTTFICFCWKGLDQRFPTWGTRTTRGMCKISRGTPDIFQFENFWTILAYLMPSGDFNLQTTYFQASLFLRNKNTCYLT